MRRSPSTRTAPGAFENLSREVMDALNVWARFVFEPLLEDRRQTLGELTGDIHGREVAERVIAELHRAGGVDIPREFVIMDRAAIGLGAVFLRLQAEVNWHRLFNEVIATFDAAALARRQAELLAPPRHPAAGIGWFHPVFREMLSTRNRIARRE